MDVVVVAEVVIVAVAALLVGLAYGARKLLARRATAGQELTAGG